MNNIYTPHFKKIYMKYQLYYAFNGWAEAESKKEENYSVVTQNMKNIR